MLYKPIRPQWLWDSWLFPWDARYHLFYLEASDANWDHVGHAVSDDLVHWEALSSIPVKGAPGRWNSGGALTGTVVRHENKFYMFLGGQHNSVEVVGVYLSTDLEHWTEHPANPVMSPVGRDYLSKPALPFFRTVDWRDPCIIYRQEDGHYHAFLCARLSKCSHKRNGATIAHLRSTNLVKWESLPPVVSLADRFYHSEVPDMFELEGKYYLMFSTVSFGGMQINTSTRDGACGTFYMIGTSPEGPFLVPDDCLLIGSAYGRQVAYAARTIPYEGGRLLYHHVKAAEPINGKHPPVWGAPKRVRTYDNGNLWLEYMPVLERLETSTNFDSFEETPSYDVTDLGRWQRSGGQLTGQATVAGSAYKIARELGDLHLQCRVNSTSAVRAGVVLRIREKRGVAVILDFAHHQLRVEAVCYFPVAGWGSSFKKGLHVYDEYRVALQKGAIYHLRCFVRAEHFEVYLDDRWIFTTPVPDATKTGDVELVVESGEARFSDFRLASLEPLSEA